MKRKDDLYPARVRRVVPQAPLIEQHDVDEGSIGAPQLAFSPDQMVASKASTIISDPSAWVLVGGVYIDPTAISGTQITLKAIGSVDSVAATMTVKLRNVTDGTDAASVTFNSLSNTQQTSSPFSVPTSAKMYEVWIHLTGGTSYNMGSLCGASLVIS